jgi:nucleotide-binding universal stress UspA family protein
MKSFESVLCVATGGEACRPTLDRAVSLAENNQAELTVVDVIPRLTAGIGMPPGGPISADLQAALKAERLQALESLTASYRQRLGIRHAVLMGTGFLEIIRAVLRNRHDLVIKPAESPVFIERLFGSDDMHLLRKCPCPVWLTKPGEKADYQHILAAVDFDPDDPGADEHRLNRQILELSSSLALSDFAALHVVHAWEVPGEMTVKAWSDDPAADGMRYVEAERARHQLGLDHVREQLRRQIGAEAFDHLAPRFVLQRGAAARAIPELARQLRADLVVMGTVSRTGIAGLFIGNTAETILEQLGCSVLAVKPAGFVSPVRPAD